jgi:site-specific DNA recombinase
MWELAGYERKHKLQYLIFPEGISYDKENDKCLTPRVNAMLELISSFSGSYKDKKRDKKQI